MGKYCFSTKVKLASNSSLLIKNSMSTTSCTAYCAPHILFPVKSPMRPLGHHEEPQHQFRNYFDSLDLLEPTVNECDEHPENFNQPANDQQSVLSEMMIINGTPPQDVQDIGSDWMEIAVL